MNNKEKDKFVILVRIKPTTQQDKKLYKQPQLENTLKFNSTLITMNKKSFEDKVYQFNRIFSNQTQQQIFKSSEHLISEIFQGYNSTFLAYGQTGTGKTHTVFGSKQAILESNPKHPEAGIFYRASNKIFEQIHKRMHQTQFSVRISFIEFYLDNIYDMLAPPDNKNNDGKKLQLKQMPKQGVVLKDLTQIAVRSYQQLVNIMKQAVKARKTQSTTINHNSSRSHALIQITLLQRWNVVVDGQIQTKYRKGLLKIVDLAGSERVSKTQSEGTRLQQAKRINKQITTLGKCMNMLAMSEKNTGKNQLSDKFNLSKVHVPFRDSKLTRFLSESLEGKSKVVLCVCISNYAIHGEQTFSSLLFANQATTLKVDAKKNEQFFRGNPNENLKNKLNTSQQLFETPSKNRSKISLKEQQKQNTELQNDEILVNKIKNDIKLIDQQINGNIQNISFENIQRIHLENALKTYSVMIIDLQNKLDIAYRKIAQYQHQKSKY